MELSMEAKWTILWLLTSVGIYCRANPIRKKVCIIGAGPAGLTSLKQLIARPNQFEPIAFEKNSQIGGQWVYTDSTDVDEHGLPQHSAIYKYLRTNGPRQLMAFPDYTELHGDDRSFLKHQTVLEYLKNYTQHFHLDKYIKLNTFVEKLTAVGENQWMIKTRDLNTNHYEKTECDAIIVCNGNFNKPNIPKIPGIENFPGRVLHSHSYRRPEDFMNQTVVILGASFSGTDIGFEICSYAKTVYLSHRHGKLKTELPPNMIEVPGVIAADGNQFILSNGSRIRADSIILCTGYLYDYPFLDANVGISVDKGKYVHPLYKHFINVERPTMAMIGLLQPGFPFPTAYAQVHYFVSVLQGNVRLPSRAEMLKDSELPPGTPLSKAHYKLIGSVDYYEELAKASGAILIPASYKTISRLLVEQINFNKLHFREYNYVIDIDGHVQLVRIDASEP